MATPKKNVAFSFCVGLASQADPKLLQANPTLASGDVKVSIDGGAFNDLSSLPTISPASSRNILVALTSSEMNGDVISVQFVDASGAEWCDLLITINTNERAQDDLAFPTTSGRGLGVEADGGLTQLVTAIADSVPADGSRPSPVQGIYAIYQFLTEKALSGTTLTVKKPDGTTALMTFTLNDAVNPTSITRAT